MILSFWFVLCSFARANLGGCGVNSDAPLRHPYLCTPIKMMKIAIEMTTQMQNFMSEYNSSALFNLVPADTPLVENFHVPSPDDPYCCQLYGDLFYLVNHVNNLDSHIVFVNQVPPSAVVSQTEGVVRVYATMNVYNNGDGSLVSTHQVAFVWKPEVTGPLPREDYCKLAMFRYEMRSPYCSFNEPACNIG